MLGAIIGDVVGSVYEWNNIKTKDFELFKPNCVFTDDTVMTVAVAKALLVTCEQPIHSYDKERIFLKEELVKQMQDFGNRYPHHGYGGMFVQWLDTENPKPYNSFGNGSAMRVSACGYIAITMGEALELAKISAEVTHNHPEGIKGAQATAAAIFLAKFKRSKEEIKNYIEKNFYTLDKTLDEIRPDYCFNETCQQTVPQAIQAFLESNSFEDAIRNAISLGGDSDTLAAITGSIAWAYYRDFVFPLDTELQNYRQQVYKYLPQEFIDIWEELEKLRSHRDAYCGRMGGPVFE